MTALFLILVMIGGYFIRRVKMSELEIAGSESNTGPF